MSTRRAHGHAPLVEFEFAIRQAETLRRIDRAEKGGMNMFCQLVDAIASEEQRGDVSVDGARRRCR